jgi:hypothetical protein
LDDLLGSGSAEPTQKQPEQKNALDFFNDISFNPQPI